MSDALSAAVSIGVSWPRFRDGALPDLGRVLGDDGSSLGSTGHSPGVDGMTIKDATAYLREHWPNIRSQLLSGTCQPQPVKRVEIPKPDGGIRKLGVPCVVDRLIQRALLQVLQPRWDPTFSEHSW